jgi:carboxyl-terminal processing protease
MIGRIVAVVAGLWLLGQAALPAQAEPRIALVIGNADYGKEIGNLPNPTNDAALMAKALQGTGFKVIKVIDANQKQMKRAIADFGEELSNAGPEATGLFFYAGHGVQVKGVNYLVPIGADISKEADVDIESVAADTILQQMEYAGSRVNIVVLDACRNNPLQRSFRAVTRGLAPMDAAQGTFIAYSTAPGSVAADGVGKNSPYTSALAATIVQPGVGIEEAFRDVRAKVMAETQNKQVPWDSSSLTAPFYFKPAGQFITAAEPAKSSEMDLAFWNSVKDSKQAGDYEAYLSQFPNGTFAPLARSRVASLGQGSAPRQQTAPAQPEPAAAPKPAPAPAPAVAVPQPDAAESAPVATNGSDPSQEVDSRGVSCRIMDATRPQSDCAAYRRSVPKSGGAYSGGGSKSTGSSRWK